jgi:hypothetical protein
MGRGLIIISCGSKRKGEEKLWASGNGGNSSPPHHLSSSGLLKY